MRKPLLLVLLVFPLFLPAQTVATEPPPDWLLFLGRFHPLLLHLPIGFLVLALMLELASRLPRLSQLRPAGGFALAWGALLALVTAALGWMLSQEGGYSAELLSWHQWTGISTAVLAWGVLWLRRRHRQVPSVGRGFFYGLGWALLAGLLGFTGHLGGSLTHGEEYLFEYAPPALRTLTGRAAQAETAVTIGSFDETPVYQGVIEPIFAQNCESCHRAGKRKGGLRLDEAAGLLAGGEHGPVVHPSLPDSSELYQRLLLPEDDEEHMPPPGRDPLERAQVELIAWWISQGAPTEASVMLASLDMPDNIRSYLNDLSAGPPEPVLPEVEAAPPAQLSALRQAGWDLRSLAQDSPWLLARPRPADSLTAAQLEALASVAPQVQELDLAYTPLDDAMMAQLKAFPHLLRLKVNKTRITDAGVQHLAGMAYLQSLNMYDTQVSDSCLAVVGKLPRLRQLYVWQTRITEEGVNALRQSLPQLEVELGFGADSRFLPAGGGTPRIEAPAQVFTDPITVTLSGGGQNARLYYTLDGRTPDSASTRYEGPLTLDRSAVLQVAAIPPGGQASEVSRQAFFRVGRLPQGLTLTQPPSSKYPGNGGPTLTDQRLGPPDYNDRAWLGYEGEDLVATLDLGAAGPVRAVTAYCYEDVGAWIFHPKGLVVETSADGQQFQRAGSQAFPVATGERAPGREAFRVSLGNANARYLRVRVQNVTEVPAWHPSAGGKAWVFVSELMVE